LHLGVELGIELIEQRNRLPIKSKQITTWAMGSNLGQEFILIGFHGLKIPMDGMFSHQFNCHAFVSA
jgi:hypothetical protein